MQNVMFIKFGNEVLRSSAYPGTRIMKVMRGVGVWVWVCVR